MQATGGSALLHRALGQPQLHELVKAGRPALRGHESHRCALDGGVVEKALAYFVFSTRPEGRLIAA
jgi:hypothetical protein